MLNNTTETASKKYGIAADGVTDDTAAIQAWLDDLGGHLPPGNCKVASPLRLKGE